MYIDVQLFTWQLLRSNDGINRSSCRSSCRLISHTGISGSFIFDLNCSTITLDMNLSTSGFISNTGKFSSLFNCSFSSKDTVVSSQRLDETLLIQLVLPTLNKRSIAILFHRTKILVYFLEVTSHFHLR